MPNEKGGYSFYVLVINLEQQENLRKTTTGEVEELLSFEYNNNNNNNNKFSQYYHFVQVLPIKITVINS